MSCKINTFLDTRRKKRKGRYPVKLRVFYQTAQRLYNLHLDVTQAEWDQANEEKPKGEARKLNEKLRVIEAHAEEVAGKINPFSLYEFERKFFEKNRQEKVYDAFTAYAEVLSSEGRHRSAISYLTARNSLAQFYPEARFPDVTVPFLKEYERWLKKKGLSDTTVGFYTRNLRTVYNVAIEQEIVPRSLYPFGRRRYEIPLSRNIKKALTLEEVYRILQYQPEPYSFADRAKDFWLFSYLCCGMNFTDIAHLKYGDLDDEVLVFIREKTKRTSRGNQKPIIVPLLPEARAIITKWGSPSKKREDYMFPILSSGMTPARRIAEVGQWVQVTNKWIRRIAKAVGIEKDVTTYVARHTFATVMKRSGASTEFISEQLGHSNLSTTESYLDSFATQVKRDMSKHLVDFSGLPPNN